MVTHTWDQMMNEGGSMYIRPLHYYSGGEAPPPEKIFLGDTEYVPRHKYVPREEFVHHTVLKQVIDQLDDSREKVEELRQQVDDLKDSNVKLRSTLMAEREQARDALLHLHERAGYEYRLLGGENE